MSAQPAWTGLQIETGFFPLSFFLYLCTPTIIIDGGAVQLRADRSPSGNGRIYTITAIATDFAANSVTVTATCTVGNPA